MKVCILANGPSLKDHDLSRVTLPKIGTNRSWMVEPNPTAHVVLEKVHLKSNPEFHERMAREGRLYVAGNWPIGNVLEFGSGTFSKDVFKDGVVTEMNGVGSTFYAALQVAYTLGYRRVYALGLDLFGPHFDGTLASPRVARQNEMFVHVPPELEVLVAGSPESRANFPKVSFEEACA